MGLLETVKRILRRKDGPPREVWRCLTCNTTYGVVQEICSQCGAKSVVKLDEEEAEGIEVDIAPEERNSGPGVGPGMGE